MAEVIANGVWFFVVALIFLPLTGKSGVARCGVSRTVNFKTQSLDYHIASAWHAPVI